MNLQAIYMVNYRQGTLLVECLVAIAVFSLGFYGLISLYRSIEEVSALNNLRSHALRIAEAELDQGFRILKGDFDTETLPAFSTSADFQIQNNISYESEASKIIKSSISFFAYNRKHEVDLEIRVTDPKRAEGLSTCYDYFSSTDFKIKTQFDFNISGFSLENKNTPTDVDVVGKYVYVTFDSGVATDTDLAVFDFSDIENPSFVSKINTGPGLSSLHVVGRVAYVSNRSINAQLQVVDLSDLRRPRLAQSFKLPGIYQSGTTLGKKVWYSRGRVYLGTDKSNANEIYIYDASNPLSLIFKSSFEINAGINDLVSFNHHLYVANPADTELIDLDVSDVDRPFKTASFNAPAGTGNGKSLAVVGHQLILGRTVGNKELYVLDTSSSTLKEISNFDRSASVDGLILRTSTLFSITPQADDMFQLFNISTSTIKKINSPKIVFPSRPLSFDCDKNQFFIIAGKSLYILSPL